MRAHLSGELGIDPGPGLKTLQAHVLEQADAVASRTAAAPALLIDAAQDEIDFHVTPDTALLIAQTCARLEGLRGVGAPAQRARHRGAVIPAAPQWHLARTAANARDFVTNRART